MATLTEPEERQILPESPEELYRTLVEQVPAVVHVVAPDDDRRLAAVS